MTEISAQITDEEAHHLALSVRRVIDYAKDVLAAHDAGEPPPPRYVLYNVETHSGTGTATLLDDCNVIERFTDAYNHLAVITAVRGRIPHPGGRVMRAVSEIVLEAALYFRHTGTPRPGQARAVPSVKSPNAYAPDIPVEVLEMAA